MTAENEGAAPRLSEGAKWFALVLLLVVILALLVLAAEGAVRVRQYFRVGSTASYEDLYRYDPAIDLRVLRPGTRTTRLSINDQGFRGPPIEDPKPAGRVRIAFLGASTTFCAEVSSNEAVWPHLATAQLAAAFPSRTFDYVNGGVPGYTVNSSRKNLRHRVGRFAPDVIVIYHATNNLSGELRNIALERGIVQAEQGASESWLERQSLLWELVVKNLRVRSAMGSAGDETAKLRVDASSLGAAFEQDLTALVREARAVAKVVVLVTFSTRLRAERSAEENRQAAVSAMVYSPFMTIDGLIQGYARYNTIIREVAAREGAVLIAGEHAIPADASHFADAVHFTDLGSQVQARRVAEALRAAPAFRAVAGAGAGP